MSASGSVSDDESRVGCRNPLIDPRDGTALGLVRSDLEQGAYSVADGRYGVGPGELLRVDCATGAPIGVVDR